MRRFAKEDRKHTLCVVVTGKDQQAGMTWAQGVAAALVDYADTSLALVMFSGANTGDNIAQAISDHEHARLCIIAMDEGVPATLSYMGKMSSGVTEYFVACFRTMDLYDDGAYKLLQNAEAKIGNFIVVKLDSIDDDGAAANLTKNVVNVPNNVPVGTLGVACGSNIPQID